MRLACLSLTATLVVLSPNAPTQARAQQRPNITDKKQTPSESAKPDIVEIPISGNDTNESKPGTVVPSTPLLKIANFTSCPMAELQRTVPDLAHLKIVEDQSSLPSLLDKIGATTVEVARKTPNLISNEAVLSETGGIKTRSNFSYLVVQHSLGSQGIVLDEYRVDVATGKKFDSESAQPSTEGPLGPSSAPLSLPSSLDALAESDSSPHSQGFVNDWLHFYPSNRRESDFRYLGQQKMEGHHTLVLAFAQKPGFVRLPAVVQLANKRYLIFTQGIAWVDAADFRIVRLRTDLLSVPSQLPLRQLTADVHFSEMHIANLPSPLWLPYQVAVVTKFASTGSIETHRYSNYRLFRAHSKLVLNP